MLHLILAVMNWPMVMVDDWETLVNHISGVVRVVVWNVDSFQHRVFVEWHRLDIMLIIECVGQFWMEAWILRVLADSVGQQAFF